MRRIKKAVMIGSHAELQLNDGKHTIDFSKMPNDYFNDNNDVDEWLRDKMEDMDILYDEDKLEDIALFLYVFKTF